MNRNACEINTRFYFYAQKANKTKNRISDFTGLKSNQFFFSPTNLNPTFESSSGGEGTDKFLQVKMFNLYFHVDKKL